VTFAAGAGSGGIDWPLKPASAGTRGEF